MNQRSKFIGLIYDCDGTLVDSQNHIVSGFNQAFVALGEPEPERQAVISVIGLSLHEAVYRLAPDLSPSKREALVSEYMGCFRSAVENTTEPLFDGAYDHLKRMCSHGDYRLGVATGKSLRGLNRIVKIHGLEDFFDTLQASDNHASKPSPEMLISALEALDIAPEDAVMIGDTTFDLLMGQAAGTKTVAVSWGYHKADELQDCRPDALVHSFDALEDLLKQLF